MHRYREESSASRVTCRRMGRGRDGCDLLPIYSGSVRSGDSPAGSSAAADSTAPGDGAGTDAAGQASETLLASGITPDPGDGEDTGEPAAKAKGGERAPKAKGRAPAAKAKGRERAPKANDSETAAKVRGARPREGEGWGAGREGEGGAHPRSEPAAKAKDSGPAAKDGEPAAKDREPASQRKIAGSGLAVIGRRLGHVAGQMRLAGAGCAFARLTTLPVILVMAWLLPGVPLLLAGSFIPAAMLLISAPLAVALVVYGLRRVPGRWPQAMSGGRPDRPWTAWWGVAGTIVVAVGFGAWQLHANSAAAIVSRDPGTYLQSGYWIAQHGTLTIPKSLAAFGGAHPGLSFSSIGFFPNGTALAASGMSGLPMLIAGGFWIHGLSAASAMSPIIGALALLTFGGLTGRLAGPQWAPAGALVLGFTLPQQYTSRSAFSETLMQLLLIGGLCLLIDSLTLESMGEDTVAAMPRGWPRWLTPGRALAALAGLALGLSVLARVDALVYLLPVIPFVGVLLAGHRRPALPFSLGFVAGVGYGLADGYLGSRPYMETLAWPLRLVGLIAAGLAVLTAAGVLLLRRARLRSHLRKVVGRRPLRWLPEAAGVLGAAALIGLAVRPYVQIVRVHANPAAAAFVARLQRLEHLPVDPSRLYAEDTLYWVIWYVGTPAVLLGGLGLALLLCRTVRALLTWQDVTGAARNWALPLVLIGWGAAAVLWQPGTVPDQPWASRRLVPLVLPGLVLGAIWASAWLVGWARQRGAGTAAWSFVGSCCVAALLVPTAVTTFGIGLTHSGKAGSLRPVVGGLAAKRTSAGETDAVRKLCTAIGTGASVVILDRRVAQQFTQAIRGMCGVPTGWMSDGSAANVKGVLNGISSAGRRPVLLARDRSELASYGTNTRKVLDLRTTQDSHELTQPPTAPWPARYVIWLAAPSTPSVGT